MSRGANRIRRFLVLVLVFGSAISATTAMTPTSAKGHQSGTASASTAPHAHGIASARDPDVTLEGTYRLLHADPVGPGAAGEIQQLEVKGELKELRGPRGLAEPNERIKVKGKKLHDDAIAVEAVTSLASAAQPAATTGVKSVLVMLAYYTAPGSKTPSQVQAQIGTTAADWYREVSYSLTDLTATVTPWLKVSDPGGCGTSTGQGVWRIEEEAEQQARAQGFDPDSYSRVMTYFVDGGSYCRWAGLAYIGGRHSWIRDPYMDTRVTTHELGHNLGLSHSHSLDCGTVPYVPECTAFDDYGDQWDSMGNCCFSETPGHFNAVQKNLLGWMGGGRATTQTAGAATYTLSPLEQAGTALRAVNVVAASGRSYWIEKRSASGKDAFLTSYPGITGGVLVHMPQPMDGTNGSNLLDMTSTDTGDDAALAPGGCWLTPDQIAISVNSATATSASVTVRFGGSCGATVPAAPQQVTATAGDASATVSWAPPATDGGAAISSYRIQSEPGGHSATVAANARTATMTGLDNGTAYTFTVTALNAVGAGPPSAPSLAVTPTTAGTALVNEGFSSATTGMTSIRGGAWGASNGRYALTSPAAGLPPVNGNIAVHATEVGGNFTLSAQATTTATTSPWNDFSIVFGYRDPSNYYYFSSSEGNDAKTNGIFRVSDGVTTQIADATALITAGVNYQIRLERDGTAIRAYRNNTLVATATDPATITGRAGFATMDDAATFDDLLAIRYVPGAAA